MTTTQSLAIDIIKLVPDNSESFIDAPSLDESSAILKLLQPSTKHSNWSYDWHLILTPENKLKLINVILSENIQEYFHRLQINYKEKVLLIAYDGFSGVGVEKEASIPDWFTKKYADALMF